MKFKNLLTAAIAVVASVGISSQSFAIPVSMDGEGYVTSYTYSGSVDPFGGSIGINSAFSSMTVLDPDTAFDTNELSGVGQFNWFGSLFQTNATVGQTGFTTGSTRLSINNDYNGNIDIYRIDSWGISDSERVLFNIILKDVGGQAFDSDSFVLEPDLGLFDSVNFQLRSWDNEGNLNYRIWGNLTSLVDPPLQASVPEPRSILLLGLGLLGVFYAGKRKSMSLGKATLVS